MSERVSTGIEKLDEILNGGLPTNSNIILFGPPLIGKTTLSLQYIYKNLKSDNGAVLISTNRTSEEIQKRMRSLGWEIEKYREESFFKIIDCYSYMIGMPSIPSSSVIYIPGLLDLTKITVTIHYVCSEFWKRGLKICLVFDSISSLLLYSDLPVIMRFLHVFMGRLRMVGATSLFVVEEGMHDPGVITSIEQLIEGVIYLESDEKGRYLKIENFIRSKQTEEKLYCELTSSGFSLI